MTKKERLSLILNLIANEEISTQEELTDRLVALNCDASQATISRDINELNLIKATGITKKFKYVKADVQAKNLSPQMLGLLKQIVTSIDYANNLVVIKTLAGNANSAGIAIDEMQFPEVLGTVAGDDTLLIISRSNADAEMLVKTLKTLL